MDEPESDGRDGIAPSLGGQSAGDALIAPPPVEVERAADLAAFIGPNLEKFVSSPERGGREGWRGPCWPGLFAPVAWFMYRKMYGWAAVACALPIIGGALNFGPFGTALSGAPSLVGLAGRMVYVAGARRTVARLRAAGDLPEQDLRRRMAEAGGVSTAGAIVGGLIVFLAIASAFALGFAAGFKARHP